MRKTVAILMVCLMLLLIACNSSDLNQTIKTEFNDEINIHAYLTGNLHGQYLCCEVTAKDVEGSVHLYNQEMLEIPDDISDNLNDVAMNSDVRVYKLYNELIVIKCKKIESIPSDYSLNDLISQVEYNGVKSDVVYAGIKVLCETKKFEFISQFLPILDHIKQDESITKLVERWAKNEFTDDELSINKDYTRERISTWCKNYLQ